MSPREEMEALRNSVRRHQDRPHGPDAAMVPAKEASWLAEIALKLGLGFVALVCGMFVLALVAEVAKSPSPDAREFYLDSQTRP